MEGYFHLSFFFLLYPVVFVLVRGAPSENLLAFKNSLRDSSLLESWVPGKDACNFYGVKCLPGKDTISSIDLSGLPLSASGRLVASHLLTVETVEHVSLRRCNISGSVVFPSGSSCSPVLARLDLSQNMLSDSVFGLAGLRSCSALTSLNVSSNSLVFDGGNPNSDIGLSYEFIDLSFNSISGVDVVPFLLSGGCGNLRSLSLQGNKVSGNIDFSSCGNLEYLDVSFNNFSRAVPSLGKCSSLQYLDISGNGFSRNLGRAIAPCEKLAFLNASFNQFSGEVPAIPTGSMQSLALGGNRFEGGIPVQVLDACPGLLVLDLSRNNFSGDLPDRLASCSSLRVFDLSHNSFVGDLPVDLLLAMVSLRVLDLSFNGFTGSIPEDFSKLGFLETLDLSANEFSGGLPPGICRNLKGLYLQDNNLTGELSPSIGNCSRLTDLHLSFNFLRGSVPSSLGSLSLLRNLKLWYNMFEGEIPAELTSLKNLEALIMDFNYLSGSIPPGLSNCTSLNWVSLSNNKLSGEIPASLGLLPNLTILKLSNNSISGAIPPELGDCKSLIWLDLNSNNLTGIIPPELFKQSGNIAVNFISGKRFVFLRNRRSEVCHGTGNLLEFEGIKDGELNMISGRLPCGFDRVYGGHTQPTFNNNGSMMFLDLSWNGISGEIPKEIGSMLYLYIMNLGHNNITGKIPNELGFLKGLSLLDLSFNKIGGAIPQSMTGLSLLTNMDLSNNNLTGMIPEGGQFETFTASSFLNNSGLCGIPLLPCGRGERSNAGSNDRKSHGSHASLAGSIAVAIVFFIACVLGLIYVVFERKKRKRMKNVSMDVYMDGNSHSVIDINSAAWKTISTKEALSISLVAFEKPLRKLNFADLLDATNGFHNDSLIGSGGFGDVHKARLKDGTTVAIKKLKQVSGQGDREFTAEMDTLGKIKHRNLVPLLGYCKVGEERLLVYEYMKYGSLEDVLHDEKKQGVKLDWTARRNIAVGAARGLAFLHHNCIPHIIHRDMKSSNVLLDDNLEARVSDFGMARHMNAADTHLSVSTLAGTPGYVPPEYYQTFRCSTRGDVYSYGVVLLELLTGRRPTDASEFGDNNLVGWVKQHAKLKITDVFDRALMEDDPSLEIELLQHLKVACGCLDDRPWRRPTMIQVLAMFKEIQAGSDVESQSVSVSEMSIDEAANNHAD